MNHPVLNRAIFIFSLLGVMIAGYLWYMHATNNAANIPCGPSHDCMTVALSGYSHFPYRTGPPVAMYGTLGYLTIAALSFARTLTTDARAQRLFQILTLLGATFGVIVSGYLTYLEISPDKINAICRWCVASQITILILFILSLTDVLQDRRRRPSAS